jgi:hypothetical protein
LPKSLLNIWLLEAVEVVAAVVTEQVVGEAGANS